MTTSVSVDHDEPKISSDPSLLGINLRLKKLDAYGNFPTLELCIACGIDITTVIWCYSCQERSWYSAPSDKRVENINAFKFAKYDYCHGIQRYRRIVNPHRYGFLAK